MKLNIHSWHVRLNDYVYGWGYSSETKSLCPYFWGTIAAIFLAIPAFINDTAKDFLSMGTKKFLSRYGVPIFLSPIYLYFTFAHGMWTWGVVLVIWFALLFIMYKARDDNWSVPSWLKWIKGEPKPRVERPIVVKEKRKHMSIEMIKGFKNKHCPIIEWEK